MKLDEDGNYRDPLYGLTAIGNLVRVRPTVGARAKFLVSQSRYGGDGADGNVRPAGAGRSGDSDPFF